MIEKTIKDYLAHVLDSPVFLETPEEPPKRYIIVEKIGSGKEDFITTATVAVKSIAESLYKAAELNEKVKEAMEGIISRDDVCRCQLNSDYPFNNIEMKVYRYQAVFHLTYYQEEQKNYG